MKRQQAALIDNFSFSDLSTVERSVLSRLQAFCGECDDMKPTEQAFISLSRTIIKKKDNVLYFFCPNPEHHRRCREIDSLLRLSVPKYVCRLG